MNKIKLPIDKCSELVSYNPETGEISMRNGNRVYPVTKKRKIYLKVRLLGASVYVHRLVYALFYGVWPAGEIDHINGDSEDNRIKNIRHVDRKTNCKNVRLSSTSKSGYGGVNWHDITGKWRARVKMGGKEHYLGLFNDKESAAKAVLEKRKELGFHDLHGVARDAGLLRLPEEQS